MVTRGARNPDDDSAFAARARVDEARSEEIRQLLFTVHQDLLEFADTGEDAALGAARGTVIAALSLAEDGVASRRRDLEDLDVEGAAGLVRPDPTEVRPTAWSLAAAWLVVTRDTTVLAVSDRATKAIGAGRREIVGHPLAEVADVDAGDLEARLDEADRRGLTRTTIESAPATGPLQATVHRLPDTRDLQPAFIVILGTDPTG